ncbi:50S ribosomal protein L3 [Candidatus Pacearchaeota archaeon]|nr:50S ribosomal protein L3 [Candidatus Pacearchaeota archaeon]
MPKHGDTRHGSLQFYPRKRSLKLLPRAKWDSLHRKTTSLLGFMGYKVGMMSAYVRDNSPHSLTKGQRITIPVTIIECPTLKIFSIRFYKDRKVICEVLNTNFDKELKKRVKLPKEVKKKIEDIKEDDYNDIRLICYTQVKKTGIKKNPDIHEIGVSGILSEKLEFVKNNLNKEISVKDIFNDELIDIRGVTKGKGFQGIVKRFGITLKSHKSEKGRRNLGSGGPWHPARVDFTQPRPGQMGHFTRVVYNNKIIAVNSINENNINPKSGFKKYGVVKTDYIIVCGSIQGPSKRQLLLTMASRPSKNTIKKTFEFIELR